MQSQTKLKANKKGGISGQTKENPHHSPPEKIHARLCVSNKEKKLERRHTKEKMDQTLGFSGKYLYMCTKTTSLQTNKNYPPWLLKLISNSHTHMDVATRFTQKITVDDDPLF